MELTVLVKIISNNM